MKILFTVIPAAGHLNPTIPIARALKEQGHEVLYATGNQKVPLLKQLSIPVKAILEGKADTIEQVYEPIKEHLNSYNPYSILVEINYLLDFMLAIVVELEQLAENWQPDIIVADFCTPVGAAVALKQNIPWVTITTTPACIRTMKGTPSNLGGLCCPRHLGHRLRDRVGRLLLEAVRSGLSLAFRNRWRELGLSINGPNQTDGLYSPYAILGVVPEEIEYPRDWPRQLHFIGPVEWSDESEIQAEDLLFLQSSAPKVLVTMGTHLAEEKSQFFPKLIDFLASLPYQFLFTLGGTASFPNPPSTNVRFTSYVPYSEVLKHVDAVVHHGGAGIMCSCLKAGVPALVIPQGFDQPDNAQRVIELGAGIRLHLNQLNRARIRHHLQSLIENPSYKQKTSQLAATIARNYSPIKDAVAIIETVGQTRKPVYRMFYQIPRHLPH